MPICLTDTANSGLVMLFCRLCDRAVELELIVMTLAAFVTERLAQAALSFFFLSAPCDASHR